MSISLYHAQSSLYYWTMHKNLGSCLTFCGGVNARITCTFFGWGLIPSFVRMHPKYSLFIAQNEDLGMLTIKLASYNLIKTLFHFSR